MAEDDNLMHPMLLRFQEIVINLCNYNNDYPTRIDTLISAWNCVAILVEKSTASASENLLHWVLKHTVHLILVVDWVKLPQEKIDGVKSKIEQIVPSLQAASNLAYRCKYVLRNIDNPWGDNRLLSVLRGDPWEVTDSDIEFLTEERGCMIVLRLQKLCETKCDDMAFTWSCKAYAALKTVDENHTLCKSTSNRQRNFILDVYLCFLHKFGHVSKAIDEIKLLDLPNAFEFLKRNSTASNDNSRLIKYRMRVAKLASDIVIATLMVEDLNDDNEKLYCDILKEWLCMRKTVPVAEFRKIARKLFLTAISKKHIYLACETIKQMEIADWRDLLLELYVRSIAGDLNDLELLKSEKTVDEYVIMEHEVDLSHRYIYLADLLKNHSHLSQECILTAFSLNPTKDNYKLVENIALKLQQKEHENLSNNVAQSTSATAQPISNILIPNKDVQLLANSLKETTITKLTQKPQPVDIRNARASIDVLHSITGSSKILESPSYDALAAPSVILDSIESMDLPDHIRIDLSVLLSSPRLKILSWMLPWPELDSHCQKLMKEDHKLSIVRQGLADANDKLQYLHLDYSQFRHLPESECPGIEKGYEMYSVESDDDINDDDSSDTSYVNYPKKKKTKKIRKSKLDKPSKPPKFSKEKINKTVSKKFTKQQELSYNFLANLVAQLPANDSESPQYQALLQNFFFQQMQHQYNLSKSLIVINKPGGKTNTILVPIVNTTRDTIRTDRQVMPPPLTVTVQKKSSKKPDLKQYLPASQANFTQIDTPFAKWNLVQTLKKSLQNISTTSKPPTKTGRPRGRPPLNRDSNSKVKSIPSSTVTSNALKQIQVQVTRTNFAGLFPKATNPPLENHIPPPSIEESSSTESAPETLKMTGMIKNITPPKTQTEITSPKRNGLPNVDEICESYSAITPSTRKYAGRNNNNSQKLNDIPESTAPRMELADPLSIPLDPLNIPADPLSIQADPLGLPTDPLDVTITERDNIVKDGGTLTISQEIEKYINKVREEHEDNNQVANLPTQEKEPNDIIDLLLDLEENKLSNERTESSIQKDTIDISTTESEIIIPDVLPNTNNLESNPVKKKRNKAKYIYTGKISTRNTYTELESGEIVRGCTGNRPPLIWDNEILEDVELSDDTLMSDEEPYYPTMMNIDNKNLFDVVELSSDDDACVLNKNINTTISSQVESRIFPVQKPNTNTIIEQNTQNLNSSNFYGLNLSNARKSPVCSNNIIEISGDSFILQNNINSDTQQKNNTVLPCTSSSRNDIDMENNINNRGHFSGLNISNTNDTTINNIGESSQVSCLFQKNNINSDITKISTFSEKSNVDITTAKRAENFRFGNFSEINNPSTDTRGNVDINNTSKSNEQNNRESQLNVISTINSSNAINDSIDNYQNSILPKPLRRPIVFHRLSHIKSKESHKAIPQRNFPRPILITDKTMQNFHGKRIKVIEINNKLSEINDKVIEIPDEVVVPTNTATDTNNVTENVNNNIIEINDEIITDNATLITNNATSINGNNIIEIDDNTADDIVAIGPITIIDDQPIEVGNNIIEIDIERSATDNCNVVSNNNQLINSGTNNNSSNNNNNNRNNSNRNNIIEIDCQSMDNYNNVIVINDDINADEIIEIDNELQYDDDITEIGGEICDDSDSNDVEINNIIDIDDEIIESSNIIDIDVDNIANDIIEIDNNIIDDDVAIVECNNVIDCAISTTTTTTNVNNIETFSNDNNRTTISCFDKSEFNINEQNIEKLKFKEDFDKIKQKWKNNQDIINILNDWDNFTSIYEQIQSTNIYKEKNDKNKSTDDGSDRSVLYSPVPFMFDDGISLDVTEMSDFFSYYEKENYFTISEQITENFTKKSYSGQENNKKNSSTQRQANIAQGVSLEQKKSDNSSKVSNNQNKCIILQNIPLKIPSVHRNTNNFASNIKQINPSSSQIEDNSDMSADNSIMKRPRGRPRTRQLQTTTSDAELVALKLLETRKRIPKPSQKLLEKLENLQSRKTTPKTPKITSTNRNKDIKNQRDTNENSSDKAFTRARRLTLAKLETTVSKPLQENSSIAFNTRKRAREESIYIEKKSDENTLYEPRSGYMNLRRMSRIDTRKYYDESSPERDTPVNVRRSNAVLQVTEDGMLENFENMEYDINHPDKTNNGNSTGPLFFKKKGIRKRRKPKRAWWEVRTTKPPKKRAKSVDTRVKKKTDDPEPDRRRSTFVPANRTFNRRRQMQRFLATCTDTRELQQNQPEIPRKLYQTRRNTIHFSERDVVFALPQLRRRSRRPTVYFKERNDLEDVVINSVCYKISKELKDDPNIMKNPVVYLRRCDEENEQYKQNQHQQDVQQQNHHSQQREEKDDAGQAEQSTLRDPTPEPMSIFPDSESESESYSETSSDFTYNPRRSKSVMLPRLGYKPYNINSVMCQKYVKKIRLTGINSSKIAVINESSSSSPYTEYSESVDQYEFGDKNNGKKDYPRVPVCRIKRVSQNELITELATPETIDNISNIEKDLNNTINTNITMDKIQRDNSYPDIRDNNSTNDSDECYSHNSDIPIIKLTQQFAAEQKKLKMRNFQIQLDKLTNRTLLQYKQNILVGGIIVSNPYIHVKRLKINQLPVKVSNIPIKQKTNKMMKKRFKAEKLLQLMQGTTYNNLNKICETVNLSDEAQLPSKDWNNFFDTFHVSSDDDESNNSGIEVRKPDRIPHIDNNLSSKNCNINANTSKDITEETATTTTATSTANETPITPTKKNYMFDIYTVMVESEFDDQNDPLFLYKDNECKNNKLIESSDIFLALAARLIAKSLAVKSSINKNFDQALEDTIKFLLPQILEINSFKKENNNNNNNKLLSCIKCNGKCVCKRKNIQLNDKIHNNKKIFDNKGFMASPLTQNIKYDKCSNDIKFPAYHELKNLIFRSALGEKLLKILIKNVDDNNNDNNNNKNNKNKKKIKDECSNDNNSNNNHNNNNNNNNNNNYRGSILNRVFCNVPGFHTLEYFTAPSYQCLPVVRIVHSTLPLEEKINTLQTSNDSDDNDRNPTTNQTVVTNGTTKTTFIPIINKSFRNTNIQQNDTTGNVRIIIPQQSSITNKNITTSGSTAAMIKIDQKDIDRTKLEPNIVVLGCNNNSKLVSMKKDERLILTTPVTNSVIHDNIKPVQQCRLVQTIKANPKMSTTTTTTTNEKFLVGTTHQNNVLPLQFIYKSEGGMIQLTPVSSTINLTKDVKAISVVKTDFKSPFTTDTTSNNTTPLSVISTRSIYEENYAKFIHQTSSQHQQNTSIVRTVVQNDMQPIEMSLNTTTASTLPEFNQAFGKSAYNDGNELVVNDKIKNNIEITNTTTQTSKNDIDKHQQQQHHQQQQQQRITGGILLTKQNIKALSRPIVTTVVTEASTKNKFTNTIPTSARLVSTARQQIKIIQADVSSNNNNNNNINNNNNNNNSSTEINCSSNERTTLLSPVHISVPIVQPTVQARFVRPIFHITQNPIQSGIGVSTTNQQVIVNSARVATVTSKGRSYSVDNILSTTSSSNNIIPSTVNKLKCLPTLAVSKCGDKHQIIDKNKKQKNEEQFDNSTLEQLREFDLVLEQVKERSITSIASSPTNNKNYKISEITNNLKQQPHHITLINPQEMFNTKINMPINNNNKIDEQQKGNFSILQKSPVVVLANNTNQVRVVSTTSKQVNYLEKANITHGDILTASTDTTLSSVISDKQSQLSSSSSTSTTTKSRVMTKSTITKASIPAIPSSVTFTQQKLTKPQEDEQTVQRIYDILAEYAEQLRNSPDLNNKPAPRRRSNPLNTTGNNNSTTKKRKTFNQKNQDGTTIVNDLDQLMDSEDSSCGNSSIYNRSPMHDSSASVDNSNQFIGNNRQQQLIQTDTDGIFALVETTTKTCPTATVTKVNHNPHHHQQHHHHNNQQISTATISSKVLNLDTNDNNQTSKTTALFVPGRYLLPINAIKSEIDITSGEQKILHPTTLRATQNIDTTQNTFKPITIQSVQPSNFIRRDQGTTMANNYHKTAIVFQAQTTELTNKNNQKKQLKIVEVSPIKTVQSGVTGVTTTDAAEIYINATNTATTTNKVQETSVITKTISLKHEELKKHLFGTNRNPQNTYLLSLSPISGTATTTASTSLSSVTPPAIASSVAATSITETVSTNPPTKLQIDNNNIINRKCSDNNNKIKNNLRLESYQGTSTSRILTQLTEGRKLAMERELKFQKSLSDECEDLGVDEPSTSDLFPEADLLFDTNTFENNSQDELPQSSPIIIEDKRMSQIKDIKMSTTAANTQKISSITMKNWSNTKCRSTLFNLENLTTPANLKKIQNLREVIGWEETEPINKNASSNLVIQHTSNNQTFLNTIKTPNLITNNTTKSITTKLDNSTIAAATTTTTMGTSSLTYLLKDNATNELNDEQQQQQHHHQQQQNQHQQICRKRRISTRATIRKANCPCCTAATATTTAASSSTLLSSSTQTYTTITCPKDKLNLNRSRIVSYSALPITTATTTTTTASSNNNNNNNNKRMRSIKVNTSAINTKLNNLTPISTQYLKVDKILSTNNTYDGCAGGSSIVGNNNNNNDDHEVTSSTTSIRNHLSSSSSSAVQQTSSNNLSSTLSPPLNTRRMIITNRMLKSTNKR